jgi:exopolysaccharide biosynthesis predicted pyruvyltransferase EpsI
MNQIQELKDLLKSFSSTLYYLPNPGNAGDSLIASATHQFFEKHQIDYKTVLDANFRAAGKNVVYAGGGNFGGEHSRVAKALMLHANSSESFILLPHTLFGAQDLLAKLPKHVHIFCREKVSYEHALKHARKANVYLADDMVFNSNLQLFLNKPKNTVFQETIKEVARRLSGNNDYDLGLALSCLPKPLMSKVHRLVATQKASGAILNAFRTDVEKTGLIIPKDNIDISDVYELSSCQPNLSNLSTYRFLSQIDLFDEVHTNRLHVAIGAMKLGKSVKLYGNNYFKIRAIYDYSIKDKYQNVEWCD